MTFFSTRKLVSVCNHIHLVLSLPHNSCPKTSHPLWDLEAQAEPKGHLLAAGSGKCKCIIYFSPQVSGKGLAFELTRVCTVPCGWGFLLNHRKITSASEVDMRSMEGSQQDKSASSERQTTKGSYTLVAACTRSPAHTKHQAGGRGHLPASGAASPQLSIYAYSQPSTKQGSPCPFGQSLYCALSPIALRCHLLPGKPLNFTVSSSWGPAYSTCHMDMAVTGFLLQFGVWGIIFVITWR